MSISLVQSGVTDNSTTTTTQSVSLASGVTLGNLLVAVVTVGSYNSTMGAPTGWTQAVSNVPNGTSVTISNSIWWKIVGTSDAGATSWTFTQSGSHVFYLTIEEWNATNGWPTNPVDKTAQGDTSATPTTSTTVLSGTTATTTQTEQVWVAALGHKSSGQAESNITSGFVVDQECTSSTGNTGTTLYRVVSATGAAACQYTITTAEYWVGCIATFSDVLASGQLFSGSMNGVATAIATLKGVGFAGAAAGRATAVAALAPLPAKPVVLPPATPLVARYAVRVRGLDGKPVGQLNSFRRLAIIERFNATSDWAIELDADDPLAQLLVTPGYGITVTRNVYSLTTGKQLTSRVEITGPMTGISRQMTNNLLVVHGRDDMLWLTRREAWPATTYQFSSYVLSTSPVLFWRLDAATGSTETDRSTHGNTGTYATTGVGSHFDLNGAGLIDDPDASVGFWGNGSSTGVSLTQSTTKSPATVTGSFSVFFVLPSPGNNTNQKVCGSRAPNDFSFDLDVQAGNIHLDIGNGTAWLVGLVAGTGGGAFTWPTGNCAVCVTVSPTTWTLYVNGAVAYSGTYATDTPILWDANHTFRVGDSGAASDNFYNGPLDEIVVWNTTLPATTVAQVSSLALSRFGLNAYDTQTGAAETVIKHYVSVNLGSAAFTERQVSGLAIETDSHRGSTVTGNARFDQLVMASGAGLLQQLAIAGGNIGYKLAPINGVLTFSVYVPTDRTNSVIFSQPLGNLLDYTYTRDAPDSESGGNVQVVGGSGQGAARAFTIQTNSTSISAWGRSEQFVDARDTNDATTLVQRGQAALAASAETDTFNAVIAPSPQTVYGVDFNLGDKVTAIIDGFAFQDIIREVDITLESGKAEVITPIMGTPGAIVVPNALFKYLQTLNRSLQQLKRLQTTT